MPEWLVEYGWVIAAALALVIAAIVFMVPRRDPRPPLADRDAENRPRLEPRKPEIAPAMRNRFAEGRPDPGSTSAPTPDPEIARPSPPVESPAPVAKGAGDDLTRLKGVGPKLAALLAEHGVTRFDQIAAWSDEDAARIDAGLGRFSGRIERDDWRTQAGLLAKGDDAGFASRFGSAG